MPVTFDPPTSAPNASKPGTLVPSTLIPNNFSTDDLYIFISPNAVNFALHLLDRNRLPVAAKLAAAEGNVPRALLLWNGGGNRSYPDDVLARTHKYARH